MKADDTIHIRVVVKGFFYHVYLLVGGCLFGFPFGLPPIQVCFVKFACEKIYALMYLVVFIGDIAMF